MEVWLAKLRVEFTRHSCSLYSSREHFVFLGVCFANSRVRSRFRSGNSGIEELNSGSFRLETPRNSMQPERLPSSQGLGDDCGGDTPVPIPNTEVKSSSADGTWLEITWESRTSPVSYIVSPRKTARYETQRAPAKAGVLLVFVVTHAQTWRPHIYPTLQLAIRLPQQAANEPWSVLGSGITTNSVCTYLLTTISTRRFMALPSGLSAPSGNVLAAMGWPSP